MGRVERLCAHAMAQALERSPCHLRIDFIGPGAGAPLTEAGLRQADLYVQPGGQEVEPAYRRLHAYRDVVRDYVTDGGRFLGVCLGGYLAGSTPGFGLLPGDAERYIELPGASVRHDGEAVIPLFWRGEYREVYFQDGPHFVLDEQHDGMVLARYSNGAIAAAVHPFGQGTVGVVGPHPEAPLDWLEGLCDDPADAVNVDLTWDIVATLLQDPFRNRLPEAGAVESRVGQ
jgi:hypothetical protein